MSEEDAKRRSRTTPAECWAMVEFLQVKENLAIMTGQASKGKKVKGGQRLTKSQGYKLLAKFVNSRMKDSERVWTPQSAKSRFESYMTMYKSAIRWQSSSVSDEGITTDDMKKNILTIDAKLESMCRYYKELDMILGDRPNIRPPYTIAFGGSQEVEDHDYEIENSESMSVDGGTENQCSDDENDPSTEAYWASTAEEDPGAHFTKASTKSNVDRKAQVNKKNKQPSFELKPTTQKKDFSSYYLEAQSNALSLERDKFEYAKATKDRAALKSAEDSSLQIKLARASLLGKLVDNGVLDPSKIKEMMSIAFDTDIG
ncbi:hypothetical protein AC1031_011942 [Aphanomyces cochlioides]|nr:hypothetical protein AC1031_011942 [Aphanomyces cochlioides]